MGWAVAVRGVRVQMLAKLLQVEAGTISDYYLDQYKAVGRNILNDAAAVRFRGRSEGKRHSNWPQFDDECATLRIGDAWSSDLLYVVHLWLGIAE